MAAANTTALELLGKTVSFEYVRFVQLTEHSTAVIEYLALLLLLLFILVQNQKFLLMMAIFIAYLI